MLFITTKVDLHTSNITIRTHIYLHKYVVFMCCTDDLHDKRYMSPYNRTYHPYLNILYFSIVSSVLRIFVFRCIAAGVLLYTPPPDWSTTKMRFFAFFYVFLILQHRPAYNSLSKPLLNKERTRKKQKCYFMIKYLIRYFMAS